MAALLPQSQGIKKIAARHFSECCAASTDIHDPVDAQAIVNFRDNMPYMLYKE